MALAINKQNTISVLNTAINEFHQLWENIIKTEKKKVKELIISGYNLHVDFYYLVRDIDDICDENIDQLELVKYNIEKFKEEPNNPLYKDNIFYSCDSIDEEIIRGIKRSEELKDGIKNNIKDINDTKNNLDKKRLNNRIKGATGGAIAGSAAGGATALAVMTGLTIGTGGAAAIGILLGGGIIMGVSEVVALFKLKEFKKLKDVLTQLSQKMDQLQNANKEFMEDLKLESVKIRHYAKSSENYKRNSEQMIYYKKMIKDLDIVISGLKCIKTSCIEHMKKMKNMSSKEEITYEYSIKALEL